ncbi:MAG: serine hydrolase [Phycisphaerales bacterium]|nr:serine hydrolase [Phycisphaerales bacterium]
MNVSMPILLLAACSQAATGSLEADLESLREQFDVPALTVLLLHGDKVVEQASVGVRVRGGESLVTLDDRWHLGSCTKAMTATLAGRLVDQELLAWDTTIAEMLPERADTIHPAYRDVTMHELLAHRGGIPGELGGTEAWQNAWQRQSRTDSSRRQREAFIDDILVMEPVGERGEYVYSNAGVTIAAHMCEVAAGSDWEDIMLEQVFGPLGMTTAGYGPPLSIEPGHPTGHLADGTSAPPLADNPPAITPAGRVHCTMEDWSRFISTNLPGAQGSHSLLDPETVRFLHDPAPWNEPSYSPGWSILDRPWADGPVLMHAGSNTMWYCVAWVAPGANFAVLAACNQGGNAGAAACDAAVSLCIAREYQRRTIPLHQFDWDGTVNRTWIGRDFWANRLQDWRVRNGRLECIEHRPKMAQRTAHLLTRSVADPSGRDGSFRISVETGAIDPSGAPNPEAWSGLLIGAGNEDIDHRLSAQVHHVPAEDGGLLCVVDEAGRVELRRNDLPLVDQASWAIARAVTREHLPVLPNTTRNDRDIRLDHPFAGRLDVHVECADGRCRVIARSVDEQGRILSTVVADDVEPGLIDGNIAMVSTLGAEGHWFDDLDIRGSLVEEYPDRAWGPVLMTQYTIDEGTLKLTAQLAPLGAKDTRRGVLEILNPGGEWTSRSEADMDPDARTISFRVEGWDASVDTRYRVRIGESEPHEGRLRPEPVDGELVLGAMNCQKVFTGDLKWNHDGIWMPHNETVDAVAWHDPDLLFFAGDQIYEGDLIPVDRRTTEIAMLDYLTKWYRFCWSFESLTRDRPTVTIPDDHDVYHGNIWGAGGRKAVKTGELSAQDSGGYRMPARFVNVVHATQTSHLPDPVDPEPIEQGITVYFTDLDWGGVDFAILGDRMFKSSPSVAVPAGKFRNGWPQAEGFTGPDADVEGAELLGPRQEAFLEDWATDWSPDNRAKVVLSQTLFANLNTLPPGGTSGAAAARGAFPDPGDLPMDWSFAVDGDSNAWPQTPRNDALRSMRKGFAFHVCGDQHLGSTSQYGVESHRDAAWAFCLPAVSNTWPRRWYPPEPGGNRQPGEPMYTGDFLDGFGNRVSVAAVANPARSGRAPSNLHDRMPGYGIVRMQLGTGDVVLECWPRWSNPAMPEAEQYPGWPVRFNLLENAEEPTGMITGVPSGATHVRVIDPDSGDVHSMRALWNRSMNTPISFDGPCTVEFIDGSGEVIERRENVIPR